MRTLNEKVAGLMEFFGTDSAEALSAIESVLREQDRDTRHACAEAVIQHGDAPALEMIDRCYAACINARAV